MTGVGKMMIQGRLLSGYSLKFVYDTDADVAIQNTVFQKVSVMLDNVGWRFGMRRCQILRWAIRRIGRFSYKPLLVTHLAHLVKVTIYVLCTHT